MTHPTEAIAAVARALADSQEQGAFDNHMTDVELDAAATALLDTIIPAIVAQAVAAERDACAKLCDDEADRCDDAVKWGGAKAYIRACKTAAFAHRNRAAAIRARGAP